jgi:hypothetical protein
LKQFLDKKDLHDVFKPISESVPQSYFHLIANRINFKKEKNPNSKNFQNWDFIFRKKPVVISNSLNSAQS